MAKEFTLSTGKMPTRGLPRNSVVRITEHPDIAVTALLTMDSKSINANKHINTCSLAKNLKSTI